MLSCTICSNTFIIPVPIYKVIRYGCKYVCFSYFTNYSLSVSVDRFKNDRCTASGDESRVGTCYTPEECTMLSGTNSGTCAGGYGTCCTCEIMKYYCHMKVKLRSVIYHCNAVSIGCGGKSSENCTYFESSMSDSASFEECSAAICPCSHNICQVIKKYYT